MYLFVCLCVHIKLLQQPRADLATVAVAKVHRNAFEPIALRTRRLQIGQPLIELCAYKGEGDMTIGKTEYRAAITNKT